ncbi:universal stress protein [Haloarcula nitratireducens]|uniref:Universal stress protein n=1 Tax=Haloarcula nitratireducens TaxID=2487749 RepID=A0AAW4PI88_9EURY|nr:universal stress protein [Halomicroarcula nitratireducens]MBX0297699.1 universal stress protein [Halomicroarcula nitratireducens]
MYQVLLSIDGSEDRARQAVSAVTDLPRANTEVAVTILNVFEEFDAVDDSGGRVKSSDLYENYQPPSSVEMAQELLDENGIEWTFRKEHGDPAETILTVAGELGTSAIVVAPGSRSPVGKVLFGSVTQGILLDADQPVIVA